MRRVGLGVVLGVCIAGLVGVLHLAVAHARRIPARTPPSAVSVAVQEVSDRVAFAEHTLAIAHKRVPHVYVVSLAAMSYVVGHVSAPQYGYLREIVDQPLPVDAEDTLRAEAGICGNATNAMVAILNRLHVESRRVSVFYSTPHALHNGHATLEVRYGGAWHWFDPTWGTIYVKPNTPQWDVLSLVDVLRLPSAERGAARIGDDSRLWARIVSAAGHSVGIETGKLFLTMSHLRVDIAGRTVYRR